MIIITIAWRHRRRTGRNNDGGDSTHSGRHSSHNGDNTHMHMTANTHMTATGELLPALFRNLEREWLENHSTHDTHYSLLTTVLSTLGGQREEAEEEVDWSSHVASPAGHATAIFDRDDDDDVYGGGPQAPVSPCSFLNFGMRFFAKMQMRIATQNTTIPYEFSIPTGTSTAKVFGQQHTDGDGPFFPWRTTAHRR